MMTFARGASLGVQAATGTSVRDKNVRRQNGLPPFHSTNAPRNGVSPHQSYSNTTEVGKKGPARSLAQTPIVLQALSHESPKLVSTSTDPFEQQAHFAADALTQTNNISVPDRAVGPEFVSGNLRPISGRRPAASHVPPVVHQVLNSSGQPMDAGTRSYFEPRFGRDLSHVRLHSGDTAARSADAVRARAYTVGSNIVLGRGEPSAGSGARRLLAHELTHVLQQESHGSCRATPTLQCWPIEDNDEYRKKRESAARIAPGRPLPYRQATEMAECARIMGDQSGEYCRQAVLGEKPPAPVLGGSKAFNFSLGSTAGQQSVEAYYFPGQSEERALIVGGVHGSELAGIEVAELLKDQLQKSTSRPYFSVVIVPSLFPDNRVRAEAAWAAGTRETNIGRWTKGQKEDKPHDPNRKYPTAGVAFDEKKPATASGVPMEPENIMLLKLIDEFHPTRFAALHTTHDVKAAGFYADPRTDSGGIAKDFTQDEALAVRISDRAQQLGANVPGNDKKRAHPALYPLDPAIAKPGAKQIRDTEGNTSSFGGWSSTDVKGGRPAMTTITMEVDLETASKFAGANQAARLKELEARSTALREIFLGPKAQNDPP